MREDRRRSRNSCRRMNREVTSCHVEKLSVPCRRAENAGSLIRSSPIRDAAIPVHLHAKHSHHIQSRQHFSAIRHAPHPSSLDQLFPYEEPARARLFLHPFLQPSAVFLPNAALPTTTTSYTQALHRDSSRQRSTVSLCCYNTRTTNILGSSCSLVGDFPG